jgi:hypothetical protein
VTFMRAQHVWEEALEENIKAASQADASEYHIGNRVWAPRAGLRMVSGFAQQNLSIFVTRKRTISISLCVTKNYSPNPGPTFQLSEQLTLQLIQVPPLQLPKALASLNVLCDKIQHDILCEERICRTQKEGALYSETGKRLHMVQDMDMLYADAVAINNSFHTQIQSLLEEYGNSCELERGPIKAPSRSIEKVVRRYS